MADQPPQIPQLPQIPPYRSKRPSFGELASEITGSHSIDSDPPALRWLDRRIGRALRLTAWWIWRTKGGTLVVGGIGAVVGWLVHHFSLLAHWIK